LGAGRTKQATRRRRRGSGLGFGPRGRRAAVIVSIPANHPSACGEGRRGAEPLLLLCAPLLYGWFQPGGGTIASAHGKTRRRPTIALAQQDVRPRGEGSLARRTGRDASDTTRPNNGTPADTCGRVTDDIRRRGFVPAPGTAGGAHAPITCRSQRTLRGGARWWGKRNRNVAPY
jgi:hypothetical protein